MKLYFRTSYPCMHCIHCCGGDFKANCSFTQSQPLFSCSTLCDGNSIFASWRVLKQVLPRLVGCCVRYKQTFNVSWKKCRWIDIIANFMRISSRPTWFSDWDQGHIQTKSLEHSGSFTNDSTFVYICSNGTTHFNTPPPPPQKITKGCPDFEFLQKTTHVPRNASSLWNCSLQTAN